MCSKNEHLLRIFAAADFSHHICRFHRTACKCILHVKAHAHFFPALGVPFELPLILRGKRQNRDGKIHVETKYSRVRKVHSRGFRPPLPSPSPAPPLYTVRLPRITTHTLTLSPNLRCT